MKGIVRATIKAARKVHVIGIASQEGRAVFDYLIRKGFDPVGHENTSREEFMSRFLNYADAYTREEAEIMGNSFLSSGSEICFSDNYLSGIEKGDAVIVSQAYRRYPANKPVIELAEAEDIFLFQAIELAFDIAPCLTIGVTGTAGKSTTVSLIRNMIVASGRDFYFSGNDRENKWDLIELENISSKGIALFEVSHRHLMDLKSSPDVAVIVNIYPHHLDDAGSFENYVEIKKNLIRFQSGSGKAIVNWSLLTSGLIEEENVSGELLSFGGPEGFSAGYVRDGILCADLKGEEVEVAELSDLPFGGEHNILNALAAAVAAMSAGLSEHDVKNGLMAWKPLKYRIETIYEEPGLIIINDGKSSDPLATIEAVRSVPNIDVIVLGGVREGIKAGDFVPLGEEIANRQVKNVVVYGTSREDIVRDLEISMIGSEINIFSVSHHDEAFDKAFEIRSEGAIIFSPACQSFDEFKDYRERAEAWNSAVKNYFS